MKTTINNRGCPIPGTSQQKEPVRLIDASNVMEAVFCAVELYNSEYLAIQHEIEKIPTIDPESLRTTAHWISVKDRLPAKHERVLIYDSVCHNIYMAWRDDDLDVWFSEEYLPDFVYVTHWMPLPKPPEVTP